MYWVMLYNVVKHQIVLYNVAIIWNACQAVSLEWDRLPGGWPMLSYLMRLLYDVGCNCLWCRSLQVHPSLLMVQVREKDSLLSVTLLLSLSACPFLPLFMYFCISGSLTHVRCQCTVSTEWLDNSISVWDSGVLQLLSSTGCILWPNT